MLPGVVAVSHNNGGRWVTVAVDSSLEQKVRSSWRCVQCSVRTSHELLSCSVPSCVVTKTHGLLISYR